MPLEIFHIFQPAKKGKRRRMIERKNKMKGEKKVKYFFSIKVIEIVKSIDLASF